MSKTRWTPDLIEQVRLHAAAGHTMRQASAALGVNHDVLATKASIHKIRFHGRRGQLCRRLVDRQAAQAAAKARCSLEIAQAHAEAAGAAQYKSGAWEQ